MDGVVCAWVVCERWAGDVDAEGGCVWACMWLAVGMVMADGGGEEGGNG